MSARMKERNWEGWQGASGGSRMMGTLGKRLALRSRKKYINIPSGKYIYVHKYVYICVYTYLCKMDEYRYYAGLS